MITYKRELIIPMKDADTIIRAEDPEKPEDYLAKDVCISYTIPFPDGHEIRLRCSGQGQEKSSDIEANLYLNGSLVDWYSNECEMFQAWELSYDATICIVDVFEGTDPNQTEPVIRLPKGYHETKVEVIRTERLKLAIPYSDGEAPEKVACEMAACGDIETDGYGVEIEAKVVRDVCGVETLRDAVSSVAKKYNITKALLFGSYANGTATADSDIDIIVEFTTPSVSLFKLIELRDELMRTLGKTVDIVHGPIAPDTTIEVDKTIELYSTTI